MTASDLKEARREVANISMALAKYWRENGTMPTSVFLSPNAWNKCGAAAEALAEDVGITGAKKPVLLAFLFGGNVAMRTKQDEWVVLE